ncbi:Uncharacterized protein PBTT_05257 [Plasmodiophora brassicae]
MTAERPAAAPTSADLKWEDKDPVTAMEIIELRARERAMDEERLFLIGQQLKHCYRKYGVTHHRKCEKWCLAYLEAKKQLERPRPFKKPLPDNP